MMNRKDLPWFQFAGVGSDEFDGLIVTSMPPPQKPSQRKETVTISGRDGELNIPDGSAESLSLPISLYARDRDTAERVSAWLYDSGDLILSTAPNKIFSASMYESVEWTEDEDFNDFTATVKFTAHPYPRCDLSAAYHIDDGGSIVIRNNHDAAAYPLFSVARTKTTEEAESAGAVTLTVGTVPVLTLTDEDVNFATIDCDIMETYDENRSQLNEFSLNYPIFQPGKEYTVRITGGAVDIDPRWRCKA